jgi:hypothetical protein
MGGAPRVESQAAQMLAWGSLRRVQRSHLRPREERDFSFLRGFLTTAGSSCGRIGSLEVLGTGVIVQLYSCYTLYA